MPYLAAKSSRGKDRKQKQNEEKPTQVGPVPL